MALPVWQKSWNLLHWKGGFEADSTQNNESVMVAFKDLLKASGHWTVIGSSDGSTWNMTGTDLWTGVAAMSNQNWIVLQNTNIGAAGAFQICLDFLGSSYAGNVRIYFSPGGNFVSDGTTSTSVPPVASDRRQYRDSFLGSGGNDTGDRFVDLWYSTDGTAWRAIAHGNQGADLNQMWVLEEATSPRTDWTDNYLFYSADPVLANWTSGINDPWVTADGIETTMRMTAEGNNSGWLVEQDGCAYINEDDEWVMQKALYWFCNNSRKYGIWGKPTDWWFVNNALATKTLLPSTGATTHIIYHNVVLPWDNTAPWEP